MLRLLHIETCQIAEGNEAERALALVSVEIGEMLQQGIASLFDSAYLVIAFCLRVDIAHLRISLRSCG